MSDGEESAKSDSRESFLRRTMESTKKWNAVVKTLSFKLKNDIKDIIDLQAETISYRQDVVDEIKTYSVNIYKLVQKMKVLTKERFEYYATAYQVKTSAAEKIKLIDADLSFYQQLINDLYEHDNFLRETSKNLDNINYGIKNAIELANILGGYK